MSPLATGVSACRGDDAEACGLLGSGCGLGGVVQLLFSGNGRLQGRTGGEGARDESPADVNCQSDIAVAGGSCASQSQ
jgi:hypothetical protein